MVVKKNRVGYLDVARGIAIILMVIFHIVPRGFASDVVYSFHMPLFIIVSGYFYKEETFCGMLKKIWKKMFVPYLFCIVFVYLIQALVNWNFDLKYLLAYALLGNSNAKLSSVSSVGVLWFIPFLCSIKIWFWILKRISKNSNFWLFMLVVCSCFVGIVLSYSGIYLPWSFDAAMACVFFYYIGYVLKKYNILKYLFENKILFLCIMSCYILSFICGGIEIAVRNYPFGIICFIPAIAGSLIVFFISKGIEEKLSLLNKGLEWCGRNSIYILAFHYMESLLIDYGIFELNVFLLVVVRILIIIILAFSYLNVKNEFLS